jgi:hypothetical protein
MRYPDSMDWPQEIVQAFSKALTLELKDGLSKAEAVQFLLDETARRATWRAQAEPDRLAAAYCTPYTPLGALIASCLDGKAIRLGLEGPKWGVAVAALYDYVRGHADEICRHFRDSQEVYDDRI